jgi:TATA-box binding protein (TBP) (component of TFIID and TFIIIB)
MFHDTQVQDRPTQLNLNIIAYNLAFNTMYTPPTFPNLAGDITKL